VCAPALGEPLTSTGQLAVDGFQVVFGDDMESSFIAKKGDLDNPLVHMIVKNTPANGVLYYLRGTVGPLKSAIPEESYVEIRPVGNSVQVKNVELEDWELEDWGPMGFCKSIRPLEDTVPVLPPSWAETMPRILPSSFRSTRHVAVHKPRIVGVVASTSRSQVRQDTAGDCQSRSS